MATRGNIAIVNEDGSITSIYVHWDSYPEYVCVCVCVSVGEAVIDGVGV